MAFEVVRSRASDRDIEETDGTLSYWALAHPSPKPDFHHPDGFVLELPQPPATHTRDAQ